MQYGSTEAICTYDNTNVTGSAKNKHYCLFMGKKYDMGEMCAHQFYAVGQYAVLSCSKTFSDSSVRKIKIFKIVDGMLIGSVSTPPVTGYTPSSGDKIAV